MLHNDTQNERDDSKTKLKTLKSRCDELSKSTPLKCALCPQSDLGILNTFADLIRNAKQAVFLSVPFWLHDVIGNAILGLSDGKLIFFHVSIMSLKSQEYHSCRSLIPQENHSKINLIMVNTKLEHQVRNGPTLCRVVLHTTNRASYRALQNLVECTFDATERTDRSVDSLPLYRAQNIVRVKKAR